MHSRFTPLLLPLSLPSAALLFPSLDMDTLLLHCQSMASPKPKLKRPCCSPSVPSPEPNPVPNSYSFSIDGDMDSLLESVLAVSDSSKVALNLSFDRLLDSRSCDSEKSDMIDRALKFGSVLVEAAKRSTRKRSLMHNAVVWALPSDLTIKVFSLLDTQSLCYAAATCSFFRKCAVDPTCYNHIDLTSVTPKINNAVVSTMIQRAGRCLKSLKLGLVPGPIACAGSSEVLVYSIRSSSDGSGISWNDKRSRQGKESSILTRSCLAVLNSNGGFPGGLLKRLHLYNIERMDNTALCSALSACPSLHDLEIVGLHVELRQTLESVSQYCPLVEHLFFESTKTGRDDSLKLPTCNDLVNNCPNMSSLALRGFKLHDYKARVLVKGFRKLKYVDFSTSYSMSGSFLKNLGGTAGGSQLEVLLLRDCIHLKEVEVARFISAILAGDFKHLKHLDISNREGLASEGDWYRRCCSTRLYKLLLVMQI
ncbi:OLC1v1007290C2 [Oldenlandia corymbosa var. corymbosa]|uniref:OLC1v1007290C2 n=1 Tax=Oldenlandia corymbosa var. corymbosa TaxID=529605 RepID=A0AAV1DJJ0_OLDCO|nr:OLC1v1007290C2 [Oldenlandia corymbosa var. corymbosa]